jgi:prepilin peptidase CpaA
VAALVVTVVALGAGAVVDAKTRRIPNALTLATATLGVALAATGVSHVSVAQSLGGLLLGMLLMLPGYLIGATGAGDVKLLGAAGAVLGVRVVPLAFVYTAIAGGVLALVVAIMRGRLAATLRGLRLTRTREAGRTRDRVFAYGPAIAVGCVLAALRQ